MAGDVEQTTRDPSAPTMECLIAGILAQKDAEIERLRTEVAELRGENAALVKRAEQTMGWIMGLVDHTKSLGTKYIEGWRLSDEARRDIEEIESCARRY